MQVGAHDIDGATLLLMFGFLVQKPGSNLKFMPSSPAIVASEGRSVNREQSDDDYHNGRKPISRSHD